MYNNIGLKTVRGSGTNGYVQTNLAKLPTNWNRFRGRRRGEQPEVKKARIFKPDPKLIAHNTKRAVEVKVFEFRTKLEDQDFDDDNIEDLVEKYREELQAQLEAGTFQVEPPKNKKNEKDKHDLAMDRMKKNLTMKKALGISEDHVHGRAFDQDLQEAERRDRIARREKEMDLEEKIKSYDRNYLDRMGERGGDGEANDGSRRERERVERRVDRDRDRDRTGKRSFRERRFSRSSSRGTKRKREEPPEDETRRERRRERERNRHREERDSRPERIERWTPGEKGPKESVDPFNYDEALRAQAKRSDRSRRRTEDKESDDDGATRKRRKRRKKKKKKRKKAESSDEEERTRVQKKQKERERRAARNRRKAAEDSSASSDGEASC